jgi:hypothetical protein
MVLFLTQDRRTVGPGQSRGSGRDSFEHLRSVCGGRGDDAQDLGRRGLLSL